VQSSTTEGDSAASEDDQSDDGVFFASKIIDDQAGTGNAQVGGWSTFLEENMSSSAASEVDNGSVGDACGDFGHDSSSLKIAFQETLAKVSPSSANNDVAAVSAESAEEDVLSSGPRQSLGSTHSSERFSQQQPLIHNVVSRQSFPPSVPAATAISLIPVTASSPVSQSFDPRSPFQESAEVKQVCRMHGTG
jgi:hypothetical protein